MIRPLYGLALSLSKHLERYLLMAPGIPTGALIHYLFIYFIKESAFMQNESEA